MFVTHSLAQTHTDTATLLFILHSIMVGMKYVGLESVFSQSKDTFAYLQMICIMCNMNVSCSKRDVRKELQIHKYDLGLKHKF